MVLPFFGGYLVDRFGVRRTMICFRFLPGMRTNHLRSGGLHLTRPRCWTLYGDDARTGGLRSWWGVSMRRCPDSPRGLVYGEGDGSGYGYQPLSVTAWECSE